jgi:hypothetical protein
LIRRKLYCRSVIHQNLSCSRNRLAIAGKGEASENSFRQAIYLACSIFRNRQMHNEISKNQLKHQNIEIHTDKVDEFLRRFLYRTWIMIDYIKGIITQITPAFLTIETGGMGYFINISLNTFTRLEGKNDSNC